MKRPWEIAGQTERIPISEDRPFHRPSLDQRARSANAVATAPTDLFVLRRSDFDEICRERPLLNGTVLGRLATVLAVRLRRANVELRSLHDA